MHGIKTTIKQNHFLKWRAHRPEQVWGTPQLNRPRTIPSQSTVMLIIQSISIAATTTTDCIMNQTEPTTALCLTGNTSAKHREGSQRCTECRRTQTYSQMTNVTSFPWSPPYIPVFQFASSFECSTLTTLKFQHELLKLKLSPGFIKRHVFKACWWVEV